MGRQDEGLHLTHDLAFRVLVFDDKCAYDDVMIGPAALSRVRALCVGLALIVSPVAMAAELLMFTRADCAFCRKWEREIEPIYAKTPESRTAVLRKVWTDRPLPADIRFHPPILVTPTFVLMDEGREIGRFAGYSDDGTFWGLLTMLLRRLDDMDPPQPLKTSHESAR